MTAVKCSGPAGSNRYGDSLSLECDDSGVSKPAIKSCAF